MPPEMPALCWRRRLFCTWVTPDTDSAMSSAWRFSNRARQRHFAAAHRNLDLRCIDMRIVGEAVVDVVAEPREAPIGSP
jgi:hypothetical protein